MRSVLVCPLVLTIIALAHPLSASTLELTTINVGSNFSTCLGPTASTSDGAEASINCGGQAVVQGFALPVSMSTQAFANATPNASGLSVTVDIQNGINTGILGSSNDPTQFNSAVGFNLDAETQDNVTLSAGASATFTWGIHAHIVNLSGDGSGSGPFSEHASFGFTPVLQSSDQFWSCDLDCRSLGERHLAAYTCVCRPETDTGRDYLPGLRRHLIRKARPRLLGED